MLAILALGTVEHLINQWIDLDYPTRLQLNQLEGKLLRVVIDAPQLSVDVWFDVDKVRINPTPTGMSDRPSLFEQRPYDQAQMPEAANTTLHVSNLIELVKLLNSTPGETGNIPLQGDMSLLQQLQRILAQAEPDLASKLAPWIGAIPASQLAKGLQQGQQQFSRITRTLLHHGTDTLAEDSGLFAARWQMDRLKQGSRELRQEIERLQARMNQLQQVVAQKLPLQPQHTQVSEQDNATLSQQQQSQQQQ